MHIVETVSMDTMDKEAVEAIQGSRLVAWSKRTTQMPELSDIDATWIGAMLLSTGDIIDVYVNIASIFIEINDKSSEDAYIRAMTMDRLSENDGPEVKRVETYASHGVMYLRVKCDGGRFEVRLDTNQGTAGAQWVYEASR
jgi:hypothetical protein